MCEQRELGTKCVCARARVQKIHRRFFFLHHTARRMSSTQQELLGYGSGADGCQESVWPIRLGLVRSRATSKASTPALPLVQTAGLSATEIGFNSTLSCASTSLRCYRRIQGGGDNYACSLCCKSPSKAIESFAYRLLDVSLFMSAVSCHGIF